VFDRFSDALPRLRALREQINAEAPQTLVAAQVAG